MLQFPAGSWYFDEVTRTATVVLNTNSPTKGSPKGTYIFIECTISNKCLPYPIQTVPQGPRYLWYVPFDWHDRDADSQQS